MLSLSSRTQTPGVSSPVLRSPGLGAAAHPSCGSCHHLAHACCSVPRQAEGRGPATPAPSHHCGCFRCPTGSRLPASRQELGAASSLRAFCSSVAGWGGGSRGRGVTASSSESQPHRSLKEGPWSSACHLLSLGSLRVKRTQREDLPPRDVGRTRPIPACEVFRTTPGEERVGVVGEQPGQSQARQPEGPAAVQMPRGAHTVGRAGPFLGSPAWLLVGPQVGSLL